MGAPLGPATRRSRPVRVPLRRGTLSRLQLTLTLTSETGQRRLKDRKALVCRSSLNAGPFRAARAIPCMDRRAQYAQRASARHGDSPSAPARLVRIVRRSTALRCNGVMKRVAVSVWALEAFACNGPLTESSSLVVCGCRRGNVALWRENVQRFWTNDLGHIRTCHPRCHRPARMRQFCVVLLGRTRGRLSLTRRGDRQTKSGLSLGYGDGLV